MGLVSLVWNFSFFSETENFIPYEMVFIDIWENYYESLNNVITNDAVGLFISYYVINSFEFILIGLFLLIGTLVVVNLNKFNKNIQYPTYNNFLEIFSFFKNWINFFFLRKQDLTDQEYTYANTRVFSKK